MHEQEESTIWKVVKESRDITGKESVAPRGESTFEGLSENQHGWNQGSKAKLTRFKMRLLERQSADHSRSC